MTFTCLLDDFSQTRTNARTEQMISDIASLQDGT